MAYVGSPQTLQTSPTSYGAVSPAPVSNGVGGAAGDFNVGMSTFSSIFSHSSNYYQQLSHYPYSMIHSPSANGVVNVNGVVNNNNHEQPLLSS